MALPGEIPTPDYPDESVDCTVCGANMPIMVHMSFAGYYVGYECPNCGPYARISGYFRSAREAQDALDKGTYTRRDA